MKKNTLIIGILVVIVLVLGVAALLLSTPPSTERCIITVFGEQYDVTDHRRTHPGGDIYICGSDMSETYRSQHGTDITRIERLKVQ